MHLCGVVFVTAAGLHDVNYNGGDIRINGGSGSGIIQVSQFLLSTDVFQTKYSYKKLAATLSSKNISL